MSLQVKEKIIAKLSAAFTVNALPTIRESLEECILSGLSEEDINEVISISWEIQQLPSSHSKHLIQQFFKQTKNKAHQHSHHNHNHTHTCQCGTEHK